MPLTSKLKTLDLSDIKDEWKKNPIFNKYIKKKLFRYSENEIDEMIDKNVGQLEYFYLIKKDLVKFKVELNDYVGAVCRKNYPGFQQRTEIYGDLREDVCIFVLGCLEGKIIKKGKTYEYKKQSINKKGKLVNNKFPSYVRLLISWELIMFFRRYNQRRKHEVDFSLCNENQININEISIDFMIKKHIMDFKLDISMEDVYDYLTFGTYEQNCFEELKLIVWLLKKSY